MSNTPNASTADLAPSPHRATDPEFDLICEKLGREPNHVELAMFSLMWSEHCSYKHSKNLLKTLPIDGPKVLMGPGENAGVVDVGQGLAVAFKVESHNHPSAVEPFQGAATGVGGILRDIFACGARPIAILDSLRFGELSSDRSRYLFDHAVGGIGHYGNSIGVATVGGEIYFEDAYEQNCLVNAMCIGLANAEEIVKSAAAGVGNALILFGASTGRDGIGGASVLASAEFGEDDSDKRPTVQIGDPFEESKLLECSLELLSKGLIVGLQDLGAAGLTSSASEMASKGEVGLNIDLSKVPLREQDLEAFEIAISESQERMLCVVVPENVDDVLAICAKWDIHGTQIGEVTDTRRMELFFNGEQVTDIPVTALVDDCPVYDLNPQKPEQQIYPAQKAQITGDLDPSETLLALLGSSNIASRKPAFERYDCLVGSRTARRPEQAEAAVLRLTDDGPTIATAIDGNGRRVAADPFRGTIEVVLECAANLACVGAAPLGLTNCLNFGNPEKPEIAWQLSESIRGMAIACIAVDAPVIGGNVSLYNQSPDGPIYPTPVIGIVGELPDPSVAGINRFNQNGLAVALLGPFAPDLAASQLSKLRGEQLPTELPDFDISKVVGAQKLLISAVRSGAVTVARDISDGGIVTAIAECCLATTGGAGQLPSSIGAQIDLTPLAKRAGTDLETTMFGEGPGGFVIAGQPEALLELSNNANRLGVGFVALGTTGGDQLKITCNDHAFSVTAEQIATAHDSLLK